MMEVDEVFTHIGGHVIHVERFPGPTYFAIRQIVVKHLLNVDETHWSAEINERIGQLAQWPNNLLTFIHWPIIDGTRNHYITAVQMARKGLVFWDRPEKELCGEFVGRGPHEVLPAL